jgi:hypothetical protein
MYVVLNGSCSERARAEPGDEAAPAPQAATAPGVAPVPAPAAPGAPRPPLRAGGGRRGATWEEAAFTEEERARLEVVKAELLAGQQHRVRGLAQTMLARRRLPAASEPVY